MSEKRFYFHKKGQLTIFIILGIMIVSAAVLFFVFRGSLTQTQIPASIEPAYNALTTCIQEETLSGIDILETQGGYIELPEFEPGSRYMPFSSQLNFAGNPVQYWYYVSGNNIQKEKVPSKSEMEEQLANFIEGEVRNCDFESYYDEGFIINLGEPDANVQINDDNVDVSLDMDLSISRGDDSAFIENHEVSVNSELGNLYDSAISVYNYEQDSFFLEDYTIDALRLYAPVDGVEQTCAPKIWNAQEVYGNTLEAVEANIPAIKPGDSDNYFDADIPAENVRFVTSSDWPNAFEVEPSEGNLLISEPVGNQPGLGILGFCYVPYHFVYDLKYPVMVQTYSGDEIFQFPLAIVIDGNKPREALKGAQAYSLNQLPQLCEQKNTQTTVNVYDTNSNPVDANVSYECFGTECSIGETSSGSLTGDFPQCANGNIIVDANGFEDLKYQYSTTTDGSVDVYVDRLYNTEIDLIVGGQDFGGRATITFTKNNESKTIVYPEQNSVNLTKGQYEIQVYAYRESSITIDSSTTQQCTDVPRSGIGGFFGFTREKCFNIEFPEQVISNALAGGGTQKYYILESQLADSETLQINADSLPVPSSLESLQDNYVLFENKDLTISFI